MTTETSNKNAEHCVVEAMKRGIYSMVCTAFSTREGGVQQMREAIFTSIRRHGADYLNVAVKETRSTITPRDRGVVMLVYDSRRTNPYLKYKFLHNSIIIRDTRRELEQTAQLVYDAVEHRPDLKDLIVHTCVTTQNGQRRFLIVLCRGRDDYRRVFYRNGKRVPVHDNPKPAAPYTGGTYMEDQLRKHGNTVVDPGMIRKYGIAGTERELTRLLGQDVKLRKVVDCGEQYFIAETYTFRLRRNT